MKHTAKSFQLPCREKLHREFAGVIYLTDFITDYPHARSNYAYTREELLARKRQHRKLSANSFTQKKENHK